MHVDASSKASVFIRWWCRRRCGGARDIPSGEV